MSDLPAPQGLYSPAFEHDACGVAFVVDMHGRRSHDIVAKGISAELLKWKAIEVAHELSKSPNSKIVLLGDKSGLPIILSEK